MAFVDLKISPALHKYQWRHSDGAVVLRVVDEIDSQTADECIRWIGQAKSQGQSILPVVIDSPGGDVYSLLSMIDALNNSGLEIVTVCTGKAFSAASVLLAAGSRRFIAPTATVMVHQVSSFSGWLKSSDLQVESAESSKLNKTLLATLSDLCGRESNYWSKQLKKNNSADYYMSADVALRHNIVDHIGLPTLTMCLNLQCTLSHKEVPSLRHVDTLADAEKELDDDAQSEVSEQQQPTKKRKTPKRRVVESEDDEDDDEDYVPPPKKHKKRKNRDSASAEA